MTNYGLAVWNAFEEVSELHPLKPAILCDGGEISFAALAKDASSLAAELNRAVEGKVVGLQVDHPVDFMVAYFALAQCHARLVLIDPRATGPERADLLGDLAVDLLVVSQAEQSSGDQDQSFLTLDGRRYLMSATVDLIKRNADAVYLDGDFVVHTTSGSTGRPKGIALSAANVLARVESWQGSTSMTDKDRVLCMLTLSHCHGIEILMLPALIAGASVIAPTLSGITARRLATLIDKHGITLISTLPWFYTLLNETIEPTKYDLSSVRMMISASAKLDHSVAAEFKAKFGIQVRQAYGLSEIGAICLDRHGADDTLVGIPLDGVDVRLGASGEDVEEGELMARGAGLSRGYINAPEAQGEMFKDGWLWSQDIVKREPLGFRIQGRRSGFINVGGNNVSPSVIEDALMAHPAIREVAVKGFQDPVEAECIVAFVVWSGDPDLSGVKGHVRSQLAAHYQPRHWVELDALPRNSIGKIQTSKLSLPKTAELTA